MSPSLELLIKLKHQIPSLFTILNLFSGFLSIIYCQQGNLNFASGFIFLASFFDSLDGKIARFTDSESAFGKEIDSLADMVSFCLAPSILVFYFVNSSIDNNIIISALLSSAPLIMGGIRLAKFNILPSKDSGSKFFIGLPSPINALFICALILFYQNKFLEKNNLITINLLIVSISSLMLSKIIYPKFPKISSKFGKENSSRVFFLFLFLFLILGSKGLELSTNQNYYSKEILVVSILMYICTGIINNIKKNKYES